MAICSSEKETIAILNEVADLLNRHGVDSQYGIPSLVLSDYMLSCLSLMLMVKEKTPVQKGDGFLTLINDK